MSDPTVTLSLRINGAPWQGEVPANRLLVDFLRYDVGLTGTKEGCSVGVCGACTVRLDDRLVSVARHVVCDAATLSLRRPKWD